MKSPDTRTVKLDVQSRIDLIDMVQTVLGHLVGIAGFDEDQSHYMSVAVRESVVKDRKSVV